MLPMVTLESGPELVDPLGNELCARLRDLALRLSQLESRIQHGNDLLDEIRHDLHQRVRFSFIFFLLFRRNFIQLEMNNIH